MICMVSCKTTKSYIPMEQIEYENTNYNFKVNDITEMNYEE